MSMLAPYDETLCSEKLFNWTKALTSGNTWILNCLSETFLQIYSFLSFMNHSQRIEEKKREGVA